MHTFYCPEDNTEDTVVLLWMEGAQIGFNEDGTLHSINDATSIQHLTETVSAAQGTGPVGYIHGGAAGVVGSVIGDERSCHRHLTAFGSSNWARSTTAPTAGCFSHSWAPTSSRSSRPAVSSCASARTSRSSPTSS